MSSPKWVPRVCVCRYILIEPFIHSRRAAKLRVGRACGLAGAARSWGDININTHTTASLQQSFLYKQQITSSRVGAHVCECCNIYSIIYSGYCQGGCCVCRCGKIGIGGRCTLPACFCGQIKAPELRPSGLILRLTARQPT